MILKYVHMTEKSMEMIDKNNAMVFVVDLKADKRKIKEEVEKRFNVKVEKVNTQIDRKGVKRAYIKLKKDYNALDIATKLGVV